MSLYARLAWDGIRKNKRLYLPYILTCVGAVTMYYMMRELQDSPLLESMKGGGSGSSACTMYWAWASGISPCCAHWRRCSPPPLRWWWDWPPV